MKHIAIKMVLLTMLIACGNCMTGPSGDEITPSTLSLEFTGDSSKVSSDGLALLSESYAQNSSGVRISDVSKGSCEVTASWTVCSESSFQSYVLYRSETSGIPSDPSSAEVLGEFNDPNTTEYVDSEVEWYQRYYYALKTTDVNSNSVWSEEESIATPGSPPTPSTLILEEVSCYHVDVCWSTCPDTNFTSYSLYRSVTPRIEDDTSSATRLTTYLWPVYTTYHDTHIQEDITYYYALMTMNDKGLQSWSNEITVMVPEVFPDSVVTTINVGSFPEGICTSPYGDYVYVTNSWFDYVSVIRTSDNTVVATVDVGDAPRAICSLPSGDYVYVTNLGDNTVSVIRTSDNTVVATVEVGDAPEGICSLPSGDYVYVTMEWSSIVYVIRTSDNAVVDTVDVGGSAWGICALPSGDYVYVTTEWGENVYVIRTSDNAVVDTVDVGGSAWGICALPSGDYVYVTNNNEKRVSVIRTSDNTVVDAVDVGENPLGICSLPLGDYVYVANYVYDDVTVIRTSDNAVVDTVDVGGAAWDICALPSGDYVYVTIKSDNTVSVLH